MCLGTGTGGAGLDGSWCETGSGRRGRAGGVGPGERAKENSGNPIPSPPPRGPLFILEEKPEKLGAPELRREPIPRSSGDS